MYDGLTEQRLTIQNRLMNAPGVVRYTRLFTGLAVLLLTSSVRALFSLPEQVPVEKLIAIAETALQKDPKNGRAHYTLARIHYVAFVTASEVVEARLRDDELPAVASFEPVTTGNELDLDEQWKRKPGWKPSDA